MIIDIMVDLTEVSINQQAYIMHAVILCLCSACNVLDRHDGRRLALRGCAEPLESVGRTSKTVGR